MAFIIDAFARRIVGWVSRTAQASFVLDAMEQALHDRRPVQGSGLMRHSDRGVQSVSIHYTERLAQANTKPSVGSVGDSYDNAIAETVHGLFRLSSSVGAAHGVRWKQSSSPLSNGSAGSTIVASLRRLAMCRQPSPRNATMRNWTRLHWRRSSNQIASGKPGAAHRIVPRHLQGRAPAELAMILWQK